MTKTKEYTREIDGRTGEQVYGFRSNTNVGDTAMFQTVNEHDFIDSFIRMGRAITDDNPSGNFTIDGLRALFEWLEEIEEMNMESMELDVIGLCCEFAEYPSAIDAIDTDYEYTCDLSEYTDMEDSEREEYAREFFRDNTTLIEFDDGILIQAF